MNSNPYSRKNELPFDGFSNHDTNKWNSPATTVGSTTVTISGGVCTFDNTGAGTAGVSELVGLLRFGRGARISQDIKLATSTPDTGGHVESSIVLYKDSSNYVILGPYKNQAGTIDDLAYIRYSIGGTPGTPSALSGVANDNLNHSYTLGLTDEYIIIFIDGEHLTDLYFPGMHDFTIKLTAGTSVDTSIVSAEFDDFEVIPGLFDPLFINLMYQAAAGAYYGAEIAGQQLYDMEVATPGSGTISLTDTSMGSVEFTTSAHGTVFELTLIADPDKITTGFDDHGAALSTLTVTIWKKIAGSYTSLPVDSYPWIQGSLDKIISIDTLRCSEDTKIGFQLSDAPATSPVEIPYRYIIRKLKD